MIFAGITDTAIFEPVGMALDAKNGGRLYISGPIREPIKVVAPSGTVQMSGFIGCFLTAIRP